MPEVKEKARDYWSPGGEIYFSDGWAWGVAAQGSRICMGKEENILEALREGKRTGNSLIDNILDMERNNRSNK